MYFYIFIIIFIVVLVYKYDIKEHCRNRNFWERFIVVFLICVVGLRYHVGSDSGVYEWNFNTSATPLLKDFFKSDELMTQPLWEFMMSFCKTVFGSFIAMQFFHAIVFHFLAFRFIKRTTPYTFTALLFTFILLWFTNSFEVLRESISATIFLNSLFYLKEKQIVKYVLCGVIATGFHIFAVVIFVVTPLVMFSQTKLLGALCLVGFGVLQFIDFAVVNQIIMGVLAVSDTATEKALLYLGAKDATVVSVLGILRWILLSLFLPLCVILLTSKENEHFVRLVIFFLLLTQLISKLPILYRMNNYFELIYIVLLVNLLYDKTNIKVKSLRPVLVALSIGVLFMGYRDIYRPDMNIQSAKVPYDIRYFPYKTVFQDPDPLRESQDYYY